MIGGGALLECIDSVHVEKILILGRRSCGIKHPKITEIVHSDLTDLSSISEQMRGYDLCIHSLGCSSAGVSKEQYRVVTYDITKALADTLYKLNPNMTFLYVSGAGTDSTEKGNMSWARVKGETENYVAKVGFKDYYLLRPAVILPERGIKSRTKLYNAIYVVLRPFFSILKRMDSVTTTARFGKAAINLALYPQQKKVLDNVDMNRVAAL